MYPISDYFKNHENFIPYIKTIDKLCGNYKYKFKFKELKAENHYVFTYDKSDYIETIFILTNNIKNNNLQYNVNIHFVKSLPEGTTINEDRSPHSVLKEIQCNFVYYLEIFLDKEKDIKITFEFIIETNVGKELIHEQINHFVYN